MHVVDFLISGSKEFHKEVARKLKGIFTFGKVEIESFKFTGLNIVQKEDGIYVDQNEYVQSIKEIEVKRNVDKEAKLSGKEFKAFRGLTGKLSWAAENTRPDLAYDARELSTKNKAAYYGDLKYANKVLKKAKMEKDVTVKYLRLGKIDDLSIVAYTDSKYRNAE